MKKVIKPFTLLISLFITSCAAAADLKVVFSIGSEDSAGRLIKAYQQVRRNVKITPIYTTRGEDFTSAVEKKPDIYLGPFYEMGNYADIGLFLDIRKYLAPNTLRDIPEGFISAYAVNKLLLGLPISGYTTTLHYNKELFKQAGLQPPDSSWTWEGKFYEACRKLTKKSGGPNLPSQYGIAGMTCNQFGDRSMPSPHFESILYSYGGSIADKAFKKVTYTEPAAMDAVQMILSLHKERLADMEDYTYTYDPIDISTFPFYNGKAAMMLMYDGGQKDTVLFKPRWSKNTKPGFTEGFAVIPKGPKGRIPANWSQVACIMSTSKNKKEAGRFLEFLTKAKGQAALFKISGLPTTREGMRAKAVASKIPSPILKAYEQGKVWSARKGYMPLQFTFWGSVKAIAAGEGTMADLIETAKTQGREIIESSTYSFEY